jgi:hypothetical protein
VNPEAAAQPRAPDAPSHAAIAPPESIMKRIAIPLATFVVAASLAADASAQG